MRKGSDAHARGEGSVGEQRALDLVESGDAVCQPARGSGEWPEDSLDVLRGQGGRDEVTARGGAGGVEHGGREREAPASDKARKPSDLLWHRQERRREHGAPNELPGHLVLLRPLPPLPVLPVPLFPRHALPRRRALVEAILEQARDAERLARDGPVAGRDGARGVEGRVAEACAVRCEEGCLVSKSQRVGLVSIRSAVRARRKTTHATRIPRRTRGTRPTSWPRRPRAFRASPTPRRPSWPPTAAGP